MKRLIAGLLASTFVGLAAPPTVAEDAAWSRVAAPTVGKSRAIGPVTAGCVAGAATLPLDGPGYSVVRVSRNRYYGHSDLVGYVRELGAAAQKAGYPTLYIGDLSQPRGGPMSFGHGSHQTGRDVDVWFNLKPKATVPPAQRETIEIVSLVSDDERRIDRNQWTQRHAELLKLATQPRTVERIFVHWTIKRELCEATTGDRSWLRKIRPWYGHNDHFHVRLSCPADSPECVEQAPLPVGDGCDESLDWWFKQREARQPAPPPPPAPARPRVTKLPAACTAVLAERRR